jgi:hypothetical protein
MRSETGWPASTIASRLEGRYQRGVFVWRREVSWTKVRSIVESAYLRGRARCLRYLRLRDWTDARFDKLILADSNAIVYYQDIREWQHPLLTPYLPSSGLGGARRFVLHNAGKVLAGDWDLVKVRFEENEVYRLLFERFALGKEWSEIELFQRYAREIAAGNPRWRHSSTYDRLVSTASEVEMLYREIRDDGYRPAGGRGLSADEVAVSIGRDGQLLYNNVGGHHRLSIVKLLGVPRIPVRVLSRHRRWQDVRDEVRASRRGGVPLSDRAKAFLGHPDLQDLL